jgi:cystathionine beta-lyase/cystathionine gamma-synthase
MATKGKSARKRHSRRNVKKKEKNNNKPEEVVVNIESNLKVEHKTINSKTHASTRQGYRIQKQEYHRSSNLNRTILENFVLQLCSTAAVRDRGQHRGCPGDGAVVCACGRAVRGVAGARRIRDARVRSQAVIRHVLPSVEKVSA